MITIKFTWNIYYSSFDKIYRLSFIRKKKISKRKLWSRLYIDYRFLIKKNLPPLREKIIFEYSSCNESSIKRLREGLGRSSRHLQWRRQWRFCPQVNRVRLEKLVDFSSEHAISGQWRLFCSPLSFVFIFWKEKKRRGRGEGGGGN